VVDHPCRHSLVGQPFFQVEDFSKAHPFEVPFPVTVELLAQGCVLPLQSPVFILDTDEKDIPLPGIIHGPNGLVDGTFHRNRRFQNHFSQKAGFGQPDGAVGEDNQGKEQ